MQGIELNHEFLQYMGRLGKNQKNHPIFYYAGSYLEFCFSGTQFSITLENHKFYNEQSVGIIIDGVEHKWILGENDGIYTYLSPCMESAEHNIILFKRQDATHYFSLEELQIEGTLCKRNKEYDYHLEFYGDSVSAGAVCEAQRYSAHCDPEDHQGAYDNAWWSYTMQTARLMQASVHNIAQGGMALLDGSGYYHAPDYYGLETVYSKLCYFPEGGFSEWNFSQYTPDAVVFAIGQNDHRIREVENQLLTEKNQRDHWIEVYCRILWDLRKKYPHALFVLTLTNLFHDMDWEKLLDEVQEAFGDENTIRFRFSRTGAVTPGHPRISEQTEMAVELAGFLKQQLSESVSQEEE